MIRTILFDLDGTLLPMDQNLFTKNYFGKLAGSLSDLHEPETLISAVWSGTRAMIKNNGTESNEAVFWKDFTGIFGPEAAAEEPRFADFYENHFGELRSFCRPDPETAPLISALKAAGYTTVIASNPVFPMTAQRQRISWTGADPDSFALITSYENSRFCKPNPAYYRDILAKLDAAPEECLMVGNDVAEDMEAARAAGLSSFLITACLINREGKDISAFPNGDFAALRTFISEKGFAPLPA